MSVKFDYKLDTAIFITYKNFKLDYLCFILFFYIIIYLKNKNKKKTTYLRPDCNSFEQNEINFFIVIEFLK